MQDPLIAGARHWADLRQAVADADADAATWMQRIRGWSPPEPIDPRVATLLDRPEMPPWRPTRDPRAYVSWGTYFWTNPDTESGLPLVHRDGEASPEILRYDRPVTEQAFTEMIWLACRAHLRDDGQSLQRLQAMLNAWFVDERTAMLPHLKHAQIVPGTQEANGRPVGTIDFNYHVPRLLETVSLVWHRLSDPCRHGVASWFRAFLVWLVDGEYAEWLQRPERNNIGTYYDTLVGTIAIHLGQHDVARRRLDRFIEDRVMNQVESDGTMPAELRRTLSLTYCIMNLVGLMQAGLLCRNVGIDVFSGDTTAGSRLSKALEMVLPAAIGDEAWPHEQIQPVPDGAAMLLAALAERCFERDGLVDRAARAVGDSAFPGLHAAILIPADYTPIGAWRGPGTASVADRDHAGSRR